MTPSHPKWRLFLGKECKISVFLKKEIFLSTSGHGSEKQKAKYIVMMIKEGFTKIKYFNSRHRSDKPCIYSYDVQGRVYQNC